MSDLSSFQTTSFYTCLSFLDKENNDDLVDDEDEEETDENGEEYTNDEPSGRARGMCASVLQRSLPVMVCLCVTTEASGDVFDQYLNQLLHSTTTKCHLPPIQRGHHHVFSAEHTTRDILSLMAEVQGLNLPSELLHT